jgi:RecJ-like exonuclease
MRLFLGLMAAATLLCAADAKYGKPLTQDKPTSIATILAKPDAYVGKTVQVKGKITEVCQAMGCWLEIAEEGGKHIRLNAHETIEFPKDSAGKTVIAEGKVEKSDDVSIQGEGAVILEK